MMCFLEFKLSKDVILSSWVMENIDCGEEAEDKMMKWEDLMVAMKNSISMDMWHWERVWQE